MDLWKTLALTAFGFLLTGVVGTWLTYFWQKRNWRFQQEYTRNHELLTRQIRIVEELSDLIGHRKFRMFRAIAALRSGDTDRVTKSWASYDDSVFKWNDNINSTITKLRQFFGKRLQYDLELYIVSDFREMGAILERNKTRFDSGNMGRDFFGELQNLSMRLEEFGGGANQYVGRLWKHIDGLRNQLDGSPPVSFENEKKLKTLYLLKKLFASRIQA